jgi:hypothetical protein
MSKEPKILKPQPGSGSAAKSIFRERKRQNGFAWHEVDHALILSAFCTCLDAGHALMLSSAMGGRGVCIRIMKGRNQDAEVEYASSGYELNEWLEAIVNGYQSSSEDVVTAMRAALNARAEAAD